MDIEKIKQLGQEWEKLNEEYDGYIRELIATPGPISPEKMQELKRLQDILFKLETEIFEELNK